MQDSSTNPYIPQESQAIRSATETLHSPLRRIVKLLMIITAVLAVLIGIGLVFVIPRTSIEDKAARVELANTLLPPGQSSKLVPVKSTLGFSLKYDNQMFTSYAETVPPVDKDGKKAISAYYENDDLRTSRDYNLVRITPLESSNSERAAVADPPQLVVSSSLTVDDLKANENKPDYKGLSQLSLFVQLSTDAKLAAKTADDNTIVEIEATKPSSQTINDVKYQKVRYTTKNENYRIVNHKYDDCYYTIQHDTPIAACITNVRPNSRDDAALDEQILKTLTYQAPKEEVDDPAETTEGTAPVAPATDKKDEDSTATDEKEELLPFENQKPEYDTNFASLSAIAKNQPSAVRIGTLYCADLNLKLVSGEVATTLTDACIGNLASGTLVSQDGYIATTGHAIRYSPKAAINGYINFADNQKDLLERLDRILTYLQKSRLIQESDAVYLRTGAQVGDQEALAKIENIGSIIPDNYVTPTNDAYSYAIQPTDKPLVLDMTTGARPTFAYSDTVLEGKFVAAEYDTEKSSQGNFDSPTPAKDVGVLKVEGKFQHALLAPGNDTKSNDILNTVGFPSSSDTSIVITKSQNSPIVTNSKVNQTYDKEGQQLIQTDTAVVPGTDGAGTYNQTGKLIGFAVYGLSYCPDQQCFASGTIRSSNELLSLLEDKNMNLDTSSKATVAWAKGVDEYFKGNYSAASGQFAEAGSLYGFNRFAEPVQKLAASKQGSASDTSLMNQLLGVMIATLIAMVVLTILFAVVFIFQKIRLDSLRVGHYGAQPAYIPPAPIAAQPVYPQQQYQQAPQMPVQQPQSYQQVPQPQVPQPTQQPYQQPQTLPQPQPPYQPPVTPAPLEQPPTQPSGPVEDPFYKQ